MLRFHQSKDSLKTFDAAAPDHGSIADDSRGLRAGELWFDPSSPTKSADPHAGCMVNAWSEFVLLRPPADECEVEQAFNGTAFEFHANHVAGTTCDTERVPGTIRTIVMSSVLCTLVAVPALMANPSVVEKILEWAAVSVVVAAR